MHVPEWFVLLLPCAGMGADILPSVEIPQHPSFSDRHRRPHSSKTSQTRPNRKRCKSTSSLCSTRDKFR